MHTTARRTARPPAVARRLRRGTTAPRPSPSRGRWQGDALDLLARARQLHDLPAEIKREELEVQKLQTRLQKKKDQCAAKRLSPVETDKACSNLMNRLEGSETFLAGLHDRLRVLKADAEGRSRRASVAEP
jgi:hypothetical protein